MFGLGNSVFIQSNVIAPPAPPFDPDSADNGLSVDQVTGKIVLGNDQGDPAQPGKFDNPREIDTDGHSLILLGSQINPGVEPYTGFLNGYIDCAIDGAIISPPLQGVRVSDANNSQPQGNVNLGLYAMSGAGGTAGGVGDDITVIKFDRFTGQAWVTQNLIDDPPNFGGFSFVNIGIATNRELKGGRDVLGAAVTPYTIDRQAGDLDRKLFTNGAVAAITYNLPQANIGQEYVFAVLQNNTLTIQPDGTDLIIIDATTGAAGAPATSNTVGSVITLTCVSAGTWLATSIVGTWAV